jgi:hypothetical protein
VIGRLVSRTPVAAKTALPIAGGIGVMACSAAGLALNGPGPLVALKTSVVSRAGMSRSEYLVIAERQRGHAAVVQHHFFA